MKRIVYTVLASVVAMSAMAINAGLSVADVASKAGSLKRVKQAMVTPPFVPTHSQVAEGGPVIVEVKLVTQERELVIDPLGTTVQALTFEGSVPGPLIVVHQNDYVELTLVNPADSIMSHNIDLHAVTGALGGGG